MGSLDRLADFITIFAQGLNAVLSLRSWVGVDVDEVDPKPVETEEACKQATDEQRPTPSGRIQQQIEKEKHTRAGQSQGANQTDRSAN